MSENIIPSFLKIVTVDGSPLIADRVNASLTEIEGIKYLGNASNVLFAKNLINTVKPDVVILDINLSDDELNQTGINFLRELRENDPQMKIIIFTNHNEVHYRLVCLEKGANYFFDKLNGLQKISELIKKWIPKN